MTIVADHDPQAFALKRNVVLIHANYGLDLERATISVILRNISSRLTAIATHQLDSSGL